LRQTAFEYLAAPADGHMVGRRGLTHIAWFSKWTNA